MIKECLTKELCSSPSVGAGCIGVVRFEFPHSAIIIRSGEIGGLYCALLVRDSYLKLVELRPPGGAPDVSEARVAALQVSRSVFLMKGFSCVIAPACSRCIPCPLPDTDCRILLNVPLDLYLTFSDTKHDAKTFGLISASSRRRSPPLSTPYLEELISESLYRLECLRDWRHTR